MLGGLYPVIIFQFSALGPSLGATVAKIPVIADIPTLIDQPPIPVYLDEKTFNIVIKGTSKSVDIETDTQGLTNGAPADVVQSPIQSSVDINIEGSSDSIALALLSSLIDQIYDKTTSKQYSISFFYGATTVFRALLQSYSIDTVEGTNKLTVSIKLTKGQKNPKKVDPPGPTVDFSNADIPAGVGG